MATKKVTKKENKKEESKKAKTHPLIKKNRITEKSATYAEKGAYTFDVDPSANKSEIKKAIKKVYGVDPVKITITQISDKEVNRRGRKGIRRGGKKALVFLKKGDKITFA